MHLLKILHPSMVFYQVFIQAVKIKYIWDFKKEVTVLSKEFLVEATLVAVRTEYGNSCLLSKMHGAILLLFVQAYLCLL